MHVYRCFVEKRPGFDVQAKELLKRLREEEGISSLSNVRILCRYDVQGIDDFVYRQAREGVFSEPSCDNVYDEVFAVPAGYKALCIEALPGQFDMRADSCAQCIAMITQKDRPKVKSATLILFQGELSDEDMKKISKSMINPVETRQANMEKPEDITDIYPRPEDVPVLTGFTASTDLQVYIDDYGLAMDIADITMLQEYFRTEGRDPSETELRVIDTYWSDHCRHTTFFTRLDNIDIQDPAVKMAYDEYLSIRKELYGDTDRPITLMDLATCGAKALEKRGIMTGVEKSGEINACSVHITVETDKGQEPWLLMFKNETHNHPTEIEPFGGAATCLGGAIRDPLSGRAYVYQAMRVTGAADPRTPIDKTLPGKLPQRVICRKAAAGYSSYGNQVGVSTGLVSEIYHPGYAAKRMETGAVVGAVREKDVVRLEPVPGDLVILLGGRTGRDGCGGATGSSKSHSDESLETCGAEVQKGNAPEERKIQRLFRNPEVTRLIKRCNDFGAGGVSVAVGELADGLDVNLDLVPKKYEGLSGTEIAISESQERMAVVIAPADEKLFMARAETENLEATVIARVTQEPRFRMSWRGAVICDISREFLNSNGAAKTCDISVPVKNAVSYKVPMAGTVEETCLHTLSELNVGLQKGLWSLFDNSVGAGTVLMPYGGKNQVTPVQAMAAKIPVESGESYTASVMSYGFDPYLMEANPYLGAQASCISAAAKLAATGCDIRRAYYSFQEFFEKPGGKAERMGKPFAALLGALKAQTGLGIGAIGGKDSMSGTFNDLDVPPTLIAFAVSSMPSGQVLSPEFKQPGCNVYYLPCPVTEKGEIDFPAAKEKYVKLFEYAENDLIGGAWAVTSGGVIEGLAKMAIGNDIGFDLTAEESVLLDKNPGGLLVHAAPGVELDIGEKIGSTTSEPALKLKSCSFTTERLRTILKTALEDIYPTDTGLTKSPPPQVNYDKRNVMKPKTAVARPLAIIPAFPGTNSEYDTKRALERAGGKAEIIVVKNLTPKMLKETIDYISGRLSQAQMLIFPGGFSSGDEPDGSGKFIQAMFRSPQLKEAVHEMLYGRDGLAMGICNGFQALIKTGLVPYGWIQRMDEDSPTLTFNEIGRHQSAYANVRVSSVNSPWLSKCQPGEVYQTVYSHGEGRFVCKDELLSELESKGQLALQYCDENGRASNHIEHNLNGSAWAVEGITSPDGRILGKMGHIERWSVDVARNIPGNRLMPLFEGGVAYFAE